MNPVVFAGVGSAVPERILSNQDLEKIVDTTDEWIVTRTGIRERRIASLGTASSDLAAVASVRALEEAGASPRDIAMILVATVTPDTMFPNTACHLQRHLGAPQAACLDVSAACTGFVAGVTLARSLISAGAYPNVLVVGAEILSTVTDYSDRNTCVLFGDAAGAALLRPGTEANRGILDCFLGADGSDPDVLSLPSSGSRLPVSEQTVRDKLHYLKMRGKDLFRFAVPKMAELVAQAAQQLSIQPADFDLIIPHQVNLRMLEAAADRLGLPREKFFINLDRYGNTSAASIPLALDEARRSGKIKPGSLVTMPGFGAGLTWGYITVRF